MMMMIMKNTWHLIRVSLILCSIVYVFLCISSILLSEIIFIISQVFDTLQSLLIKHKRKQCWSYILRHLTSSRYDYYRKKNYSVHWTIFNDYSRLLFWHCLRRLVSNIYQSITCNYYLYCLVSKVVYILWSYKVEMITIIHWLFSFISSFK